MNYNQSKANINFGDEVIVREKNQTPELPLIVQPASTEIDFYQWLQKHQQAVAEALLTHGAVLFRDFGLNKPSDLEHYGSQMIHQWMNYVDRVTKRRTVHGPVQTATDTPPTFEIPMHCESSFTSRWPQHLLFMCLQPAQQGGCTPLADVRKLTELIDPDLKQRFQQHGVLYVRNFGVGPGMDWREVFQVADQAALETYCREEFIVLEPVNDKHLRSYQVRPAFVNHPKTGASLWFNHALTLHHSSHNKVMADTMLKQLGEAGLPHQTYLGDGTAITDAEIQHIRECYQAATVRFNWQPGDLLLVDNLLVAHGRDSYQGQRQVVAALADPMSWVEAGHDLAAMKRTLEARVGTLFNHDESESRKKANNTAVSDDQPHQRHRQEMAILLKPVILEHLEIEDMQDSDDFLDMGGDSMHAALIIASIEEQTGIEIDLASFFEQGTLKALTEQLQSGGLTIREQSTP